MLQLDRSRRTMEQARFSVTVASTTREVEAAQRLRWQVFVEEQGARPEPGRHGVEADRFDPYCRHIVVHDLLTGAAVGTYRVLMPQEA
ncbi:MAG: GNAT family N-acetyltransferase, partial [Hyphomicrobiaceae bacterium]